MRANGNSSLVLGLKTRPGFFSCQLEFFWAFSYIPVQICMTSLSPLENRSKCQPKLFHGVVIIDQHCKMFYFQGHQRAGDEERASEGHGEAEPTPEASGGDLDKLFSSS
jgi:hypothetical protein